MNINLKNSLMVALTFTFVCFQQTAKSQEKKLSLKERKEHGEWQERLNAKHGDMSRECGYQPKLVLDESLMKPFLDAKASLVVCDEWSTLAHICDKYSAGKEMQASIKTVKCVYDASIDTMPDYKIEGGALVMKVGPQVALKGNPSKRRDKLKEVLTSSL